MASTAPISPMAMAGPMRFRHEVTAKLSSIPHAPVLAAAALLPDGDRIVRHYGARPGAIVPRRVLDDHLRQRMQAAGVTLHEGVAVRTLLRDQHDTFIGAEGPDLRWHARVVLAADGPGSVAWTALGRTYPRGARSPLIPGCTVD